MWVARCRAVRGLEQTIWTGDLTGWGDESEELAGAWVPHDAARRNGQAAASTSQPAAPRRVGHHGHGNAFAPPVALHSIHSRVDHTREPTTTPTTPASPAGGRRDADRKTTGPPCSLQLQSNPGCIELFSRSSPSQPPLTLLVGPPKLPLPTAPAAAKGVRLPCVSHRRSSSSTRTSLGPLSPALYQRTSKAGGSLSSCVLS
jgi:hypothetical protein